MTKVGEKALEVNSNLGGIFGAMETFDLTSCFQKWKDCVRLSPRRQPARRELD